jgi:parvulin-like peptidyl-prolyl isomerase
MRRRAGILPLTLGWVLTGCDLGGGADTAAEAGDFSITVEEVAALLAPVTELPNDTGVTETTLEFWTDYTLLAAAANDPAALEEIDVAPLVEIERSRQIVLRLRDQVIQVDTVISDDELRAAINENRPGEEIRARHILLSMTPGAPQAQADSLRGVAESLRDRARAGEDFATLAGQYSQDPGSAVQGGDLGFFGRGMMVPPFEEAAFALETGEVSDVVLSDFGFHIIRLEERRSPAFEEISEGYRTQLITERLMAAESIYLEQIETPANVQLGAGALDRVRSLALDPETELSGGNASSPITTYEGGEFTAEELRQFFLTQTPDIWEQIAAGTDEQLEQMVRELTRDRILIAEAATRGIAVTDEEVADIDAQVREQYLLIADFLALDSLQVAPGGTVQATIEEAVDSLMLRLVTNQQDIIPLGPLARPLREHFGASVEEGAVERIMARIDEIRAGGGAASPLPAPLPTPEAQPAPAPAEGAPAGGAGTGP